MENKNMETIDSKIFDNVITELKNFKPSSYGKNDVITALNKDYLDINDFAALISPVAEDFLEEMAKRAKEERMKYFGNAVYLFTPLYLSNYCENHCTYCGFNYKNKIKRGKLSKKELENELKIIAETGLEDILLLTGESRDKSDITYIGEAVKIANKYFKLVGIEIYPLNTDEYKYIHKCGADYVCVYQETYNKEKYKEVHLKGPKTNYLYRFNAQERAIKGGMRKIAFGSLLGIDDIRLDGFATGLHGYFLQKKYPQAEISFSFLRLRPFIHQEEQNKNNITNQEEEKTKKKTENNINKNNVTENNINKDNVTETQLLQIILAHRIFMPFADITISTRENKKFRDGVINIAASKMSASVKVSVGGHGEDIKGDEQFDINDTRTVEEIKKSLYDKGLQPVFIDYVSV